MKIHFTKIFASILIITGVISTSCENLLGPVDINPLTEARLAEDPGFAEGLLMRGYIGWANQYSFDDVTTDDAVSNVRGNAYRRMATGEWSAIYNPMSVWNDSYRQLFYLNYFLSISDSISFSASWDNRYSDPALRHNYYKQKYTGEAKVLRAWYNFELLRSHGGIAVDNTPQGFILHRTVPDRTGPSLPRSSYDDCVQFILADIDEGISLLPNEYYDIPGDHAWNAVFGNVNHMNTGRVNGKFAKALRSRVTLYAASMPFYVKTDKWEEAAVSSSVLLTTSGGGIDGVNGMSPTGGIFWRAINDPEIIFRRMYGNSNVRELANFPPSRFGRGETNPSQNLVDAFPMANGYPIDHSLSDYDPSEPYDGRDPRLSTYIVYDGNDINNTIVRTRLGGIDGLNETEYSTRTGYYLKKLLQPAVNLAPNVMSTAQHFYTLFRYTEIFLNYAEAANEAWGPDADPNGYGFTPMSIISALRQRAGIGPDDYLNSINTKDAMRNLIRNERRIELCFESFRFWDIRRWGLALDETVQGVSINNEDVHTIIDVEPRVYQEYMRYGPVPYQEILRSNMTQQNAGW